MTWQDRATCVLSRLTDDVFFDDVWPPSEDSTEHGADLCPEALAAAREVCDRCPVRRACFHESMREERGSAAKFRFGVLAGTTPLQRWSIEHRGSAYCPQCGTTLDPNSLRAGEIVCPEECPIDRTVPTIPDGGDRWTRRHTTLARKVIRHLLEDIAVDGEVLRPSTLAEVWKERRTDMTRVYEALVTDGTLAYDGKRYTRKAVTVGAFKAPRLLYAMPSVTGAETWEPAHISAVAAPVTVQRQPIRLIV